MHINDSAHSAELYKPDHPPTASAKIKMLKQWFNKHPALADLSQNIRKLTSTLKELRLERNFLLHGILEEWDPTTREAQFKIIKYVKVDDTFAVTTKIISLEAISSLANVIKVANQYLAGISRILFTTDALEQLRKA